MQQWIPVSERMPEEWGEYLVYKVDTIGDRTVKEVLMLSFHLDKGEWIQERGADYPWKEYGITHWMPLPEPPQ